MSNDKVKKVIAKIQQLRAISESTHSKAEKETTIALAAKLIAEYQLSEAELITSNQQQAEEIDLTTESIIYETGRLTPWRSTLAIGLAGLNGLFIYNAVIRGGVSHRKRTRYRVIGRKLDVELAMYMQEYLTHTIHQLVDFHVPTGSKRGVNPDRESWCLGCVEGFLAKMRAERDAVNKAATSTALVFMGNKAKEAEEYFYKQTGKTLVKSTYRSQAQYRSTYSSGYAKGQTLTVNPGLSGNTSSSPKKLT